MSRKKDQRSIDAAQQKIVEAASRLFAEKGYSETTTLAIAREAGVNETTIFRNFGSKKNLYAAIFCANTPGVEEILLNGLTDGENLKEDLSLMFREYITTCIQHIPNYRLSVQQIDELDDRAFYLEAMNRFESMKTQMISYLSKLESMGKIVETDCAALSEYLFSLFLVKAPQFVGKDGQGDETNDQTREAFTRECVEYAYQLLAIK